MIPSPPRVLQGILLNPGFDLIKRISNPGNVTIFVGGRGSGKTAGAFWAVEEIHGLHPERVTYAVGLPPKAREVLPRWIILAKEVEDVANDSMVVIEESALLYKARKAFSEPNLLLVDTIDIARHKNLSLIFISQSSALVDVNIMRLADTVVIKEPSLLQMEMERRQLRRILEEAAVELMKVPEDDRKGKAYVIDIHYKGLVDTGLPSFWSDKLSRLYESYQVKTNVKPTGGTVDAVSYFCGGGEQFGLCPKDEGSRYIHHFNKNKPKVVMEEEKLFILGKVIVKEEGIHDYEGPDNDYSQLDTPEQVKVLGELVEVQVDGEPLVVKDALLVTNGAGDRLFVKDRAIEDSGGGKAG